MAKPKLSYKIEKWADALGVYALDLINVVDKIKAIEGVTEATLFSKRGMIYVSVNPLYDMDDIAQEIEAILSPIPDSFKEAFE